MGQWQDRRIWWNRIRKCSQEQGNEHARHSGHMWLQQCFKRLSFLGQKGFKVESIMSFCEDCQHKTDEYCDLFDDVLFFENCIFKEDEK